MNIKLNLTSILPAEDLQINVTPRRAEGEAEAPGALRVLSLRLPSFCSLCPSLPEGEHSSKKNTTGEGTFWPLWKYLNDTDLPSDRV